MTHSRGLIARYEMVCWLLFSLAWCDGPSYAYHWGLEAAKKHLDELGAPYPEMPPFDPSRYDPMPEVEIDPPDEFGGE